MPSCRPIILPDSVNSIMLNNIYYDNIIINTISI